MSEKQINFIRQQGFDTPAPETCAVQYRALQFQPSVIGVIVLAGVILRSPLLFAALSAVLWWNALLPKRNPFDAVYNRVIAARTGRPALGPAPAPRRFAQGLAATLMASLAASLFMGRYMLAAAIAAVLIAAIAAILLAGFCFGSFLFHLLSGEATGRRRDLLR